MIPPNSKLQLLEPEQLELDYGKKYETLLAEYTWEKAKADLYARQIMSTTLRARMT